MLAAWRFLNPWLFFIANMSRTSRLARVEAAT
eukprot:CAMPEP_0113708912 /NCGR_PEP_ID=MMETSP0038_2-20120614/29264_1 /TAXON_ID=2898 /ORGANISM="Cryptomonas paramecium" /LENGTH=31 /DNA_ID=CAMNT_0000634709 /DNA_START=540 /DNA_END=631 /DNA_ORIENTATION=- /assembly_acc=CAM_ASM_000170